MPGEVKLVIDENVARMYISNPQRKNAISQSMWDDIIRHCAQLKTAQNIRALAISGEEGNFAAGADLSEKSNIAASDRSNQNQKAVDAMTSLEELPFPVVAVLEGYVIGGGVMLAAACDLRIAADNAKFRIPGAKLGIGIERPVVERLVRLIGPTRAMEMLCIGETLPAAKALTWDLVNEVVPTQDLTSRVTSILDVLVRNAPLSLKAAKQNIRGVWDAQAREGDDPAIQCHLSEDLKEGVKAFNEKREPNFIGR